jgi:hypothetical protein
MNKLILASIATAMAAATPAFAHDEGDVKTKFEAADTNKDGALTPAEFKAAWPDHADKWAEVDANKDGKVTLEEKQAAHDRMDHEKHS